MHSAMTHFPVYVFECALFDEIERFGFGIRTVLYTNLVHILCTQDLKADTDIDLENIVYYKDDTHYFVMTAKKDSLLTKGVLREVNTVKY